MIKDRVAFHYSSRCAVVREEDCISIHVPLLQSPQPIDSFNHLLATIKLLLLRFFLHCLVLVSIRVRPMTMSSKSIPSHPDRSNLLSNVLVHCVHPWKCKLTMSSRQMKRRGWQPVYIVAFWIKCQSGFSIKGELVDVDPKWS